MNIDYYGAWSYGVLCGYIGWSVQAYLGYYVYRGYIYEVYD